MTPTDKEIEALVVGLNDTANDMQREGCKLGGARRRLSPSLIRELIDYDQKTGVMTWRWWPSGSLARNRQYAGKRALVSIQKTSLGGELFGHRLAAHHAAWAWHYGVWPVGQIDHINGDGRDNRIENLREVDHVEQQRNRSRPVTNTTGVIGVYYVRTRNSYRAEIGIGGRNICLGRFKDLESAAAARRAAEITYGYHPNHGREKTA